MYVPHDVNDNPVGRVRWYRSLDLVTSEDVTDEHAVQINSASLPVMSGNLTGLFRDTYSLIIRSIGPANNGYYWSQIAADDTCTIPSPYVKISVTIACCLLTMTLCVLLCSCSTIRTVLLVTLHQLLQLYLPQQAVLL